MDGAGLTAKSLPNAMSVIAVADQGAMFDPGRCVYMDKLVVGADMPLDKAIATYLANFPQFRGLRVEYRPAGSAVPSLSVALAKSSYKPKLGPAPTGGAGVPAIGGAPRSAPDGMVPVAWPVASAAVLVRLSSMPCS